MSATHPDATVDHALPYSKDGSNRSVNLLLSCDACNGERGNVSLERFLKRMDKQGYAVRRDLVAAAVKRIERNKLCRRSACARQSGFSTDQVKKVRQATQPARKSQRSAPARKPATVRHVQPARGQNRHERKLRLIPTATPSRNLTSRPERPMRSRIDLVEELAWAYAA